ncbi:MAG: YeeE/YedE family protein, partial [Bacteroidota bacterium]
MELAVNLPPVVEWIRQPWHWAFSGAAIAGILFLMTWMGKSFGVSSSFKAICSIAGAGKRIPFFKMNIKEEYWRLTFVAGALIGGWIASTFMSSPEAVAISEETVSALASHG